MINIIFVKDYKTEFSFNFDGLVIAYIQYNEKGKLISVKRSGVVMEMVDLVNKFKKRYNIKTDDVITIVNMYFANEISLAYIGKSIFDKEER